MNAKSLSGKGLVALLKETYTEWSNDKCMRLGAALAYYSIFSIAPLIMIAIGIVGAIYGQAAAEGEVTKQLTNVLGPQMAEAVGKLVQDAGKTSSATTITGIVVLLLGASGVFAQLKDALNTIWEVKPKPNQGIWGFIRSRLLTFGIVLVIGFLMLTSLILTTLVTAFNGYIEQSLGIPPFISQLLSLVVPLAVEVLLFAMIFKLLPDAKVLWKNVWVGAAVTAVLFEIGKAFLSWYLSRPSTASSFGAASSVVLMLLWVYYSSLILFFGAEFTEVWARSTGHVIEPDDHAVRETATERAQKGMEAGADLDTSAATARSGAVNTGPIRIEPSLLSGNERTPDSPRKERLAPLIASGGLDFDDDDVATQDRGEARHVATGSVSPGEYNPVRELSAALGVGLLMGIISRFRESKHDELTPGQHLRLGTKAALLAGAAALTKMGPQLKRHVSSSKTRATVKRATDRVRAVADDVRR